MRERVGIDLDSVVCNIEDGMLAYIRDFWYPDFEMDHFCDFKVCNNPYLSEEAANDLHKIANSGDFLYSGTLYEGAKDAVDMLCNYYDIYIITGRYEDRSGKETFEWLSEQNITFNEIYFTDGKTKKDYIASLNIKHFVEDNPYTIGEILSYEPSSMCNVYCVERPWNVSLDNDRVIKVKSLLQAANIILNGVGGIE